MASAFALTLAHLGEQCSAMNAGGAFAAYITGNVAKPATYPLVGDMNVLQLIALAGGLQEYADSKNIVVIRAEAGRQQYHKFNYNDVVKRKRAEQNILLKPGDTVVVP